MVTYRNGPSAIQAYRQLLVRDSHPPVICAVGARVRFVFLLFSRNSETSLMLVERVPVRYLVLSSIRARFSFRFEYRRLSSG